MHKLYFILVWIMCNMACVQPTLQVNHVLSQTQAPSNNLGTVVFIQSTDIIASRIAQDQFTRIWKYPAKQAYLFMQKSYIDSLNLSNYQLHMQQQQIGYLLCIQLQAKPEPRAQPSFLAEYTQHFAKYMYNPIYTYPQPEAYVQVALYQASTNQLIWEAISGPILLTHLPKYLQALYPKVQKKLEQAHYFSIKTSNR